MVGSRLDATRDPLGPVLVYLAELKRGGKVDAWLTRAAAFAQMDIAPAMLERLIGMDATFQTRLAHSLKVAMDSHGVQHDGTLSSAYTVMGQDRVHAIGAMVGIDLVATELCRKTGIAPRPLVLQAVATAGAAAVIAERGRCCAPAEARLGGVFAKIGIPLLAGFCGEKYYAMWQSLAGGSCSISDAERMNFGVSHETVGSASTQFWALPALVVEAMNPKRQDIQSLAGVPFCVAVASAIVHQMGVDGGAANTPPDLPAGALERIGIGESEIAILANEISAGVTLAERMLGA
jgi:hypothetical protein